MVIFQIFALWFCVNSNHILSVSLLILRCVSPMTLAEPKYLRLSLIQISNETQSLDKLKEMIMDILMSKDLKSKPDEVDSPKYEPWDPLTLDLILEQCLLLIQKNNIITRAQYITVGGIVKSKKDGKLYITKCCAKNGKMRSYANINSVTKAMGNLLKEKQGLTHRGTPRKTNQKIYDYTIIYVSGKEQFQCRHCGAVFPTYSQWYTHFGCCPCRTQWLLCRFNYAFCLLYFKLSLMIRCPRRTRICLFYYFWLSEQPINNLRRHLLQRNITRTSSTCFYQSNLVLAFWFSGTSNWASAVRR